VVVADDVIRARNIGAGAALALDIAVRDGAGNWRRKLTYSVVGAGGEEYPPSSLLPGVGIEEEAQFDPVPGARALLLRYRDILGRKYRLRVTIRRDKEGRAHVSYRDS
jgi:hypothetical protein